MNNILCLIDSLSSGGAERQMAYLSTGLQSAGYNVTLAVFFPEHDFYREYIEKRGVKILDCPQGKNKLRRIKTIIRLIKQTHPKAVIAFKDGVTMAACIARSFKKFHLIVSERNTTQSLSRYERIKFLLYQKADHIVPNSHSQAKFIEKHFPHLFHKTKTITNAIDTDIFKSINKPHINIIPIIVTTARVMEQKNTLQYLDAIQILKDKGIKARFEWYGNLTNEYFQIVCDKIKDYNLSDYIYFHPPTKDVEKIYQNADIYCLPSLYEGFPNVICEAMACGLPIVCSDVCDNPMIVEDGINGLLFNPSNAYDIADAIHNMLLKSSEERKKIGIVNRNKIVNLCSEDAFIQKYITVINEE